MKSYNGKINLNLIIPKESSQCVCLLMIFIASVYKKKIKTIILKCFQKNVCYYRKKKSNFLTDNIEIPSDDSDKKILMKKILMRKIKYRFFLKKM